MGDERGTGDFISKGYLYGVNLMRLHGLVKLLQSLLPGADRPGMDQIKTVRVPPQPAAEARLRCERLFG